MSFRRGAPRLSLGLLLGMLLCLTGPMLALGASNVDSKRAELKQLQGRIGALQKNLAKDEASKVDAANELGNIESSMSQTNRKLRELSDKRAAVQTQLNELAQQSQQLSQQAAQQQKQLSGLLYQQFTQGGNDALRLLLAGGDPNESARDRYFFALMSRQKAQLLDDLRNAQKEKVRLAAVAREKSQDLAAIEKQQQTERAALLAKQKDRQVILAKIASRIATQKKQLDTLKGNEKRLGNLIDNLARRSLRPKPRKGRASASTSRSTRIERGPDLSNASGAFAALRGKLRLPVQGSVSERFGTPRGEGGVTWKGIVIRAAEGSDVHAVAAGTVVYSDWLRGFGNLVIIDHGDGFLSVYGNNQSLLRETGKEVKAGETIALAGTSGGNEESGLYFELRHQGQPFDPLRWISLR